MERSGVSKGRQQCYLAPLLGASLFCTVRMFCFYTIDDTIVDLLEGKRLYKEIWTGWINEPKPMV